MPFLSGKNPTPLLSKFYMFFLLSFLILTLLFLQKGKKITTLVITSASNEITDLYKTDVLIF